jgi:hypothetical protein
MCQSCYRLLHYRLKKTETLMIGKLHCQELRFRKLPGLPAAAKMNIISSH